MSQMISGCENIYRKQIIEVPSKQVVIPKFKSLTNQERQNRIKQKKMESQEAIMMKLVKKLGEKQLEQVKQLNIKIIYNKFQKLKRKMRKSAEDISKKDSIEKFFRVEKSLHGAALTECMAKNRCQQIQVSKKYGTKIFNSLATIQEIALVEKQKQRYRKWLNKQKNSPIKSPIFKSMSFALNQSKKEDSDKCMESIKENIKTLSFYQTKGQLSTRNRNSMGYIPRPKIRNLM